jgi:hypothetical protein
VVPTKRRKICKNKESMSESVNIEELENELKNKNLTKKEILMIKNRISA